MDRGGLMRLAYVSAVKGDIEVRPLLKKAGLTPQQADNSAFRLNVSNQIMFLNLVADAVADELLGFHLAQDFDLREIGMLYYVMASSDTLGDALQRAARYSKIVNEGVRLKYRDKQSLTITFEYINVARHRDRHQIEFFMISLVRLVRQLSGSNLLPNRVNLTHHRDYFYSTFKTFFGPEVGFSGGMDEIAFPSTVQFIALATAV